MTNINIILYNYVIVFLIPYGLFDSAQMKIKKMLFQWQYQLEFTLTVSIVLGSFVNTLWCTCDTHVMRM